MAIILNQIGPRGVKHTIEAEVCTNSGGIGENWIRAFTRSVEIAGKNGYVLSMPQLVQAKIDNPDNSGLWEKAMNGNSEEEVGIDKEGRFGKKSGWVFVEFHGPGILDPGKLKFSYFHRNAISDEDFQSLLAGGLPDKSQFPMYPAEQFARGIQNLPSRYGVVFPIEEIAKLAHGSRSLDVLVTEPFFIARVGGPEAAVKYTAAIKKHGPLQVLNDHYIRRTLSGKPLQSGHKIFMNSAGGIATISDTLSTGRYLVVPHK